MIIRSVYNRLFVFPKSNNRFFYCSPYFEHQKYDKIIVFLLAIVIFFPYPTHTKRYYNTLMICTVCFWDGKVKLVMDNFCHKVFISKILQVSILSIVNVPKMLISNPKSHHLNGILRYLHNIASCLFSVYKNIYPIFLA